MGKTIAQWWTRKLGRLDMEEYDPYAGFDHVALWLKARIQMGIGFVLLMALAGHVLALVFPGCGWLGFVAGAKPLEMVSEGLKYAAGVELCYMLYTQGPDEAVNPVILGLASAVVLRLAHDPHTLEDGAVIALLVASMAMIFFLYAKYIEPAAAARAVAREKARAKLAAPAPPPVAASAPAPAAAG